MAVRLPAGGACHQEWGWVTVCLLNEASVITRIQRLVYAKHHNGNYRPAHLARTNRPESDRGRSVHQAGNMKQHGKSNRGSNNSNSKQVSERVNTEKVYEQINKLVNYKYLAPILALLLRSCVTFRLTQDCYRATKPPNKSAVQKNKTNWNGCDKF